MAAHDRLYVNVNLATMVPGDTAFGAIEDGALAVTDGRIAWVGKRAEFSGAAAETVDLGGGWMLPGLIDCHTHLVYGGNRANEFEMRLNGATYQEIAAAGGGIVSTVKATRQADEAALVAAARPRLEALRAEGVTTIEIKSGYGLDLETERRMLRAARVLADGGVDIRTTFLGAHALPPEYAQDRAGYVALVADVMLPALATEGLVDAVDAFCEGIGFTPQETRRVFDAAKALGVPVKLHADQLSDLGGAGLVADYAGLSADHVEYSSEESVARMAEAGTVAVLLPGAYYFLRETRKPPVDLFRRHGVPMALATDHNPGTAPAYSLLLMLNMACTLWGLTPEEAVAGVTRSGAKALGLADRGTLEAAKRADLAVFDIGRPAELCYRIGGNPCVRVIRAAE